MMSELSIEEPSAGDPLAVEALKAPPPPSRPSVLSTLLAWWREGARTAFLLRPRWAGLHTTPAIVGWLVAVPYLVVILTARLHVAGDASFNWFALDAGWVFTLLTLWICWDLASPAAGSPPIADGSPGAGLLFSMLAAQTLTIDLLLGCVLVPMDRAGLFRGRMGLLGWWIAWCVPLVWLAASRALLIWRSSAKRPLTKIVTVVALTMILFVEYSDRRNEFWYPERSGDATPRLALTQELLEKQGSILTVQLQALEPGRRGAVDLYAITYAPYAEEDVFRRESSMVADVMRTRFDAQKRTIQLVNNGATATELPWATPLNLRRTIEKMATLMNRDEDILFIHLTSHGAHDGELSTYFYPLSIDPLTPAKLKAALDKAGIRFAVISVSACYSGSWIAPLKGDDTLVMTAADADHTSYGCGRGSELTYFGRAMFDEQLRHTRSFEEAHAAARKVIDERERAAGKPDGYSNPQIAVGAGIRAQLARMTGELESEGSHAGDVGR